MLYSYHQEAICVSPRGNVDDIDKPSCCQKKTWSCRPLPVGNARLILIWGDFSCRANPQGFIILLLFSTVLCIKVRLFRCRFHSGFNVSSAFSHAHGPISGSILNRHLIINFYSGSMTRFIRLSSKNAYHDKGAFNIDSIAKHQAQIIPIINGTLETGKLILTS
jgi:hypothetical protein